MTVRVLILAGYGINCEREMALAWRRCGAEPVIRHLSSLFADELTLSDFQLIALPGGFTFGDDLGAGRVLANRLLAIGSDGQSWTTKFRTFVDRGGVLLGICNGFQLLVKLGLLSSVSLASNVSGRFENRWVWHEVIPSHSIFTHNLHNPLLLPVRHAEGRVVTATSETLHQLREQQQIVLRYGDMYPDNPNGSVSSIAALCDSSGRILGMMAHPEAAVTPELYPTPQRSAAQDLAPGLSLFRNAVTYLEKQLCLSR